MLEARIQACLRIAWRSDATIRSEKDTITVNWVPKATEPAGYYCVQTWRENSNRTATEIGDVCAFIG